MSRDELQDATIGMAEEMLARDDRGTVLWDYVMADLEDFGMSADDIEMLFGTESHDPEPRRPDGHGVPGVDQTSNGPEAPSNETARMNDGPMPGDAVEARRVHARALAAAAIAALADRDVVAHAIGSLERPDFRLDSDVDLLVDCGRDRFDDVMDACQDSFGDFPFDIVFAERLGPGVRDAMLAEAGRLISFASIGRRADVIRRDVSELNRKAGCVVKYAALHGADSWDAETWVGITEDHACESVERLARLLRRVVLDAGGDVPAGASPAEVYALASGGCAGAVPVVRPATATLLAAMDPYETDWPQKYRDAPTALANACATVKAAEAVLADVEAFVASRAVP